MDICRVFHAWRRGVGVQNSDGFASGRRADENRKKVMFRTDAGHHFFSVVRGIPKGAAAPFGARPCLQGLVCYACPPAGVRNRDAAIWAVWF